MRIHIYQIDLENKKIEGPFFLNIDFIVNKINQYNLILEGYDDRSVMSSENNGTDGESVGKKYNVAKDFKGLLEMNRVNGKEGNGMRFRIRMFSLQNYYYNSEVLIIFDGFNVYKYIEDKTNKYLGNYKAYLL